MIFCEAATDDETAIDQLVVFASQLRANGAAAVIAESGLPADLRAGLQFDAVSFLTDLNPKTDDTIVLLGADRLSSDRLAHLHRLSNGSAINCVAFGMFETRQAEITAASRIAYSLNTQPRMMLADPSAHLPDIGQSVFAAPGP